MIDAEHIESLGENKFIGVAHRYDGMTMRIKATFNPRWLRHEKTLEMRM